MESKVLDFKEEVEGSLVLKGYSGRPDKAGTLIGYKLELPGYKQAMYYRGPWWPYGGNRGLGERLSKSSKEGGFFSILELNNGEYLAILPLCGEHAYAWFAPRDGQLELRLGTRGKARVKGNIPVVAWSRADNPYEACYRVWKKASETEQIQGWMKLREEKTYPGMFHYLGWCSWEEFRKKISSKALVKMHQTLEQNELPIRYMLIDDGHFSPQTLMPLKTTFPQGYKPLTNLRNEDGIKWIGMWHALAGNANAMHPGTPPELAEVMMTLPNGRALPKPDEQSIRAFMEYLVSRSEKDGVDFLKVDFCGTLLAYYAGTASGKVVTQFPASNENAIANPHATTVKYSRIYQEVVAKHFDGLLNCNWHTPQFIFNSGENVVGRCSSDYKLSVEKASEHLHMSYGTMPWLGQVAWGDHDMFHSGDPVAARVMAISKALSGGPVYLSDNPGHLVPEVVWPLCYQDGKLLRPLAPGAPVPEDIFRESEDPGLFRAMAPLANRSVAIVVHNFHGDGKKVAPSYSTKLTPHIYQAASGMIQPYAGKWEIPGEGLIVYNHQSKSAQVFGTDGLDVEIQGFGGRLFQLSPIDDGWSFIGRTDKYLSAAAGEVKERTPSKLTIRLTEAGPFAVWLKHGKPQAEGVTFQAKGNGLFVAELPVTGKPATIEISR
ncbi:hypothetical protein HW115_15235 [Verrucomicrobiaceae bacterium N1E253]|uniref:Raffinose synthase n=1 Tax=Oceaniferula marina TaxID=2748318 RepID=A0A851GPC6_9BACT|nr:Sip1-related alpha-galactosidase [Oceaniferula marina]NWK56975.1 hypothetical protein [Oceaniferula marina]